MRAPPSTPTRKPRSPVRLNSRPFQRRAMFLLISAAVLGSSMRLALASAAARTTCAALRSAARPPLRLVSYFTDSSLPSRPSRPVSENCMPSAIVHALGHGQRQVFQAGLRVGQHAVDVVDPAPVQDAHGGVHVWAMANHDPGCYF